MGEPSKEWEKAMSSDRRKRRRAAFAAGSHGIFQAIIVPYKARSRTGSFGLGLSIAERVAMQHHGKYGQKEEMGSTVFCGASLSVTQSKEGQTPYALRRLAFFAYDLR